MHLCRFTTQDEPEIARSGIFHDGRFYETDGERPVGVHEISKVLLLPPVQTIASFRAFTSNLAFTYRNSAVFGGALSELDSPAGEVTPDIRIAALLRDEGDQIEAEEAEGFILGYSLCIGLRRGSETDFPFALGPFLTIPEATHAELLNKPITLNINGELSLQAPAQTPDFGRMIEVATRTNRATPSDLIAAPCLEGNLPKLNPGDTVQVVHDGLGTLTVKIV